MIVLTSELKKPTFTLRVEGTPEEIQKALEYGKDIGITKGDQVIAALKGGLWKCIVENEVGLMETVDAVAYRDLCASRERMAIKKGGSQEEIKYWREGKEVFNRILDEWKRKAGGADGHE